MDLTRNHYYAIGIVMFLLGLQFRYVSSFELNEKTSRFVEKRLGGAPTPQQNPFAFLNASSLSGNRVIRPPRWLGFSLMSVGGVLFVFSLSMKRPGT